MFVVIDAARKYVCLGCMHACGKMKEEERGGGGGDKTPTECPPKG